MFQGSAFKRAARAHEMEGRACEDAALVQGAADGASMLAALCDGCSSGEDSGLLAGLLSRSCMRAWSSSGAALADLARQGWARAARAADLAGLDALRSPATLLLARASLAGGTAPREEGSPPEPFFTVEASMWGDGALAACSPSGELMGYWSAASELNMPAYPAYAFDEGAWRSYGEAGGSTRWSQALLSADFEALGAAVASALAWDEASRCWSIGLRLPAGWSFSLLSDGVGAVEGVDEIEAARGLCAGRGPGGFAERRARKAIEDWGRAGSRLGDDLSIAAIRLDGGR